MGAHQPHSCLTPAPKLGPAAPHCPQPWIQPPFPLRQQGSCSCGESAAAAGRDVGRPSRPSCGPGVSTPKPSLTPKPPQPPPQAGAAEGGVRKLAGPPGPCAIIPVSRFPEVCATAGTWEVLAGEIRVKLPSRCWEGGDPIPGKRRCHSGLCHRGRRGQSSAGHSLHGGLRGGHCSWFRGGKGPGNTPGCSLLLGVEATESRGWDPGMLLAAPEVPHPHGCASARPWHRPPAVPGCQGSPAGRAG